MMGLPVRQPYQDSPMILFCLRLFERYLRRAQLEQYLRRAFF
jgi:hypothetical protein